ncbi:MAG: hypothetical protein JSV60_05465 [Desulfobacterales bacterium]|nr:MAG: hypothetical protein JSV50_12330 [Desulfobacteraceae bacterium]UCG81723.1 MAG: hypothetical protein JSV60_05465 [Desulfobacterales bacterium]
MNGAISKKTGILSIFFIAIMTFALSLPLTCYGAEYSMSVDFSPKIINIDSQRWGEIRVFTNMRYSTFVADGDSVFIYFNGGADSVPNIWGTRDSWGNLILKFTLEDLLAVESDLLVDALNSADVVVVMNNGDEYSGSDDEVYIMDKQAR